MKEFAPILISGCARSGTSMIAGSISLCGGFGGRMFGPNRFNKKGMFENCRIRQDIVKPYLRDSGYDPLGQYPLPDPATLTIPKDWRDRVLKALQDDGYSGEQPWFYKGAKMVLMWPVWVRAFPEAKWVIVKRKPEDIAACCMRTGFMRAFNERRAQRAVGAKDAVQGWLWWVAQHEARFKEMQTAGAQVRFIDPGKLIRQDYSEFKGILAWVGLGWNDRVQSFVDPTLWQSSTENSLPEEVQ